MSIRELTYYDVKCDDCERCTADSGDYSAWSDSGHAMDDWVDGDNWVGYWCGFGSMALCEEHAPREVCGCAQQDDDDCGCGEEP